MAKPTNVLTILTVCAEWFDVPLKIIISDKRTRSVVYARHTAMYMVKNKTNLSLAEIGQLFERDHTSVIHALKRMSELKKRSAQWDVDLKEISKLIMDTESARTSE